MSNRNPANVPVAGLAALSIVLAVAGCATSATYHKLEKTSQPQQRAPIDMGSDMVTALGSFDQPKLAQSADRRSAPDLSKAVLLYGNRHTYVLVSGADEILSLLQQFPPDFFVIEPGAFHLGKPPAEAQAYQSLRGAITLVAAATDEEDTPLNDTQMSLLRRAAFRGSEQSGYSRLFNVQGMVLPARSVPAASQTAQKSSRQLTLSLVQDQDPLPPTPRHAALAKMTGALLFDAVTSPLQILYYVLKY